MRTRNLLNCAPILVHGARILGGGHELIKVHMIHSRSRQRQDFAPRDDLIHGAKVTVLTGILVEGIGVILSAWRSFSYVHRSLGTQTFSHSAPHGNAATVAVNRTLDLVFSS